MSYSNNLLGKIHVYVAIIIKKLFGLRTIYIYTMILRLILQSKRERTGILHFTGLIDVSLLRAAGLFITLKKIEIKNSVWEFHQFISNT